MPWSFGRHSMTCIRRLVNSAARRTKLRMFSISCRSWRRPRPRSRCSRSGWRKLELKRIRVSISLSGSMRANTPKPASVCCRIKTSCWRFFDFPAYHWQSLRTTSPIESTFATICHRTKRLKGCLNRTGMLYMMFKLGQCAQQRWNRLRSFRQLGKVIAGIQFKDGIEITE